MTLAMLVLSRPENISELYGLAQAGSVAARMLSAPLLRPLVAVLILGNALGQLGGCGSGVSRLPLAAGVDKLLPAAFARVHPRWATPHNSILVLGLVSSMILIAIQTGDSLRAAYQALVSLMAVGSFLPFLYIYASTWKAGWRITALVGGTTTLIVLACSAIPTGSVASVWSFEAKLAAGTFGMIWPAWLIYRLQRLSPGILEIRSFVS